MASLTSGLYRETLSNPLINMTKEAISTFIGNLEDVDLKDISYQTRQYFDISQLDHPTYTDFKITCMTLEHNCKYFENLPLYYLDYQDTYPKLNYDNIRSPVYLDDFSAVEYDTICTISFVLRAAVIEDINTIIKTLKTATADLLYKQFSKEVDKQIEDELGE